MKLVQELPEIFEEFGEKRRNAFLEVKEYKDRGVPVVGMYCAYFPTELAMAVGAIPVGLCSFSNETVMAAEKEMPKSMCPLVKSSYGFAIEDKCPFFHFADLVIGETTCDGKKKMYELMAEFKPVFVMELPNSQSESGLEFWRREVIRTKEYFEEYFNVVISDEMIRDAVHLGNEIRGSLKRLCEVMKLEPAPVFGADIQRMVTGSKYRFDFKTTPELVDAVTEKILEEYHQGKHLEKRPRILVTGCPIGGDTLKILDCIEENGGVVVAVENCSGVKTLDQMIDEEQKDIYGAIARRYLSTGCSIMTPNDNRIELLGRIIEEYQVDGVVEMILSGCHATGAESIYIRRFVQNEKKIPYIAIDTDYSSADKGQIATRITAFLEMIQMEKGEAMTPDINFCYKIILSGMSKGEPMQNILDQIADYAKIAVRIEGNAIAWTAGGLIEGERAEKKIPGKNGNISVFVPFGMKKKVVEELLDILTKSYVMYMVKKGDQKNVPDFLWILTSDRSLKKLLYYQLKENSDLQITSDPDESILVSAVSGKEERENLIALCRTYMKNYAGSILIGNGFHEEKSLQKNKNLQRKVWEVAKEKEPDKKVYLIEEYYYEFAISCISEQIPEEDFRFKELSLLKQEDEEKGKNLYDTLYWYLKMKRNVSQTAVRLGIHRNTLLPRIAKIDELLQLDEKSGLECEKLLLAMEVERKKENGV